MTHAKFYAKLLNKGGQSSTKERELPQGLYSAFGFSGRELRSIPFKFRACLPFALVSLPSLSLSQCSHFSNTVFSSLPAIYILGVLYRCDGWKEGEIMPKWHPPQPTEGRWKRGRKSGQWWSSSPQMGEREKEKEVWMAYVTPKTGHSMSFLFLIHGLCKASGDAGAMQPHQSQWPCTSPS